MSLKFSTHFPYLKKKGCTGAASNEPMQRVIIPKGMVNPQQDTIIEIPQNLQNTRTVIVKPRDITYNEFQPITSSSMRNSAIYPKDVNASASLGSSQYSNSTASTQPPVRIRAIIGTMPVDPQTYGGSFNTKASTGCGAEYNSSEMLNQQSPRSTNFTPPAHSTPKRAIEYGENIVSNSNSGYQNMNCVKIDEPQLELSNILDEMESAELAELQKNLDEFQLARRNLILRTSTIKQT